MERKYKAFISYRHLPLDSAVAKKMHRRIEHYIVPRGLRKNGEKKLGYVFRDQDELPTSSDLSANIRSALDNAEFLIVICTPETNKSRWVLNEISYFLQHHDRDHVLAVLADGRPEESFPAQLTEIRSENGELLDRIEPMAANLTERSAGNRARTFQVESLRILAPLIGCSFDDLYRREQRYKMQRIGIAFGAAAAIAAVFITVLLNRNAQIRANYEQSLRNQSTFLASESLNLLEEGDRMSAVSLAIEALPSEAEERPLVSRAELALVNALGAYTGPGASGWLSTGILHHSNELRDFRLNERETILCARSEADVLTAWDTESMQMLWEFAMEGDGYSSWTGITGFLKNDRLIAWTSDHLYCLEGESGELVWKLDKDRFCEDSWGSIYRVFLTVDGQEAAVLAEGRISRLDTASGTALASFPMPEITVEGETASPSTTYSLLSDDGSLFAFSISYGSYGNDFGGICVMDLRNGSIRTLYTGISGQDYYLFPQFAFLGNSKLVFSTTGIENKGYVRLTLTQFCRASSYLNCLDLDTNEIVWKSEHSYAYPDTGEHLYLDSSDGDAPLLIFTYSNHADIVDPSTGELLRTAEFLSPVIGLERAGSTVRCYLVSGEVGMINLELSEKWSALDIFADEVKQARSVANGFWVLRDNSSDVLRYMRRTGDEAWTPYEIAWAEEGEASSFTPDETFVGDGCFALLDDNKLLISDGRPGSVLRELLLPVDPEYAWRTGYTPVRFHDGVFWLFYTDHGDRGLLGVDIETLDFEKYPWDTSTLDLLAMFTLDHDDAMFYSIVREHPDAAGEGDVQAFFACVLDEKLRIVKQIPIGRFAKSAKIEATFSEAKELYLYLPETGDALCVDFDKSAVKDCPAPLTELFRRFVASGGDMWEELFWSQDGSKLAVITEPNRLEVYRADGEFCMTVTGETTEILSVSFTPDGKQLLTAENDEYLRRYSLKDGSLLGRTELYLSSYAYNKDAKLEYTGRGFLTVSIGNILNLVSMEDWEVFAYVPYCYGYMEEQDLFCCRSYETLDLRTGSFPRYSTRALIEKGVSLLNGWELSENQKLDYGLSEASAARG